MGGIHIAYKEHSYNEPSASSRILIITNVLAEVCVEQCKKLAPVQHSEMLSNIMSAFLQRFAPCLQVVQGEKLCERKFGEFEDWQPRCCFFQFFCRYASLRVIVLDLWPPEGSVMSPKNASNFVRTEWLNYDLIPKSWTSYQTRVSLLLRYASWWGDASLQQVLFSLEHRRNICKMACPGGQRPERQVTRIHQWIIVELGSIITR